MVTSVPPKKTELHLRAFLAPLCKFKLWMTCLTPPSFLLQHAHTALKMKKKIKKNHKKRLILFFVKNRKKQTIPLVDLP